MVTANTGKTNWLFQGLIALSMGVHLIFLLSVADGFRVRQPVSIELDLRSITAPVHREIPKPENLPYAEDRTEMSENLNTPEEPPLIRGFSPLPDVSRFATEPAPAPIQWPSVPTVKEVDIAVWSAKPEPAEPQQVAAVPSESAPSPEEVYRSRLKAVIPLIKDEAERLYARKARQRQIQGRTVVRVTVGASGNLVATRVAESSNHRMLDQIALRAVAAVSPFPKPPGGSISLDIPILFNPR